MRSIWGVLGATLVVLALALGAAAPAHAVYGVAEEWGEPGTGQGQFTDLRDVAADTAGNVFTAEAGRIQKFGLSRTFETSVAAGPGQSFQSITVAGSGASGIVYAVDRDNGILRYKASDLSPLGPLTLAANAATADFAKPRAITIDFLGNLVVAFPNDQAQAGKVSGVAIYDTNGAFIRTVGQFDTTGTDSTKYVMPLDIDDDGQVGGRVWVLDTSKKRLVRYLRSDGTYSGHTVPDSGWDLRSLAVVPGEPVNSTANPAYTVFTFDAAPNEQMKLWQPNGAFHYWFGTHGTGEGKFDTVAGMDSDDFQHLFVADSAQSKIIEYADVTPPPPPPPPPPPAETGPGGGSAGGSGGSGSSGGSGGSQNAQPQICIGLWSASTCSWLPKPNPVQTCVSYWENCNGFGGSKPAPNGTIDMSGFPTSLTYDAACKESARNPYSGKAGASQAPPNSGQSGRDEERCILDTYLEADFNAEEMTERDVEVLYMTNARTFKADVQSGYALMIQGLNTIGRALEADSNEWKQTRIGRGVANLVGPKLDEIYDRAARPGEDIVVTNLGLGSNAEQILCSNFEAQTQRDCQQLIRGLTAQGMANLTFLKQRKRELGLHKTLAEHKAEFRALKEKQKKAQGAAGSARQGDRRGDQAEARGAQAPP